ncbi:MAG TPA: ABC transporter permease [Candidatus Bipolaricaulis anaerobius]|nr:ABC transporter permease [Candidatus Bipolaricaulis anaerobius]HQM37539.1 ABC transporter permease [Candidatus Bipolaricaulis anaerobius]
MRAVLQLARCALVTALREKETLFWFVVFPLLLLSVLTLVFGHLGEEGTMNFPVALANLDREEGFASVVEEAFVSLSVPPRVGEEPLFTLRQPTSGEDAERFLAREKEAVRLGNVAALIVIPPGFSSAALAALVGSGLPAQVEVYSSEANAASTMAADVVEQVLARLNRELLTRAGLYEPEAATPVRTEWIGDSSAPVAYVDFLLPGIVLMAFFVGGLFSVSGTILFSRDLKILRRYWVTPLRVLQYLAGFALGYLAMCGLQFTLVVLLGRVGFGATVAFTRPLAVGYLVLAAVTFLAFGFFVASLANTAQAGMAIANIINMPILFLSGLFFPVADLPLFLRVLLYLNPLSYLAEGLRFSLGAGQATLPLPLTFLVPLGWTGLSAAVAVRRLRWDVAR